AEPIAGNLGGPRLEPYRPDCRGDGAAIRRGGRPVERLPRHPHTAHPHRIASLAPCVAEKRFGHCHLRRDLVVNKNRLATWVIAVVWRAFWVLIIGGTISVLLVRNGDGLA